MPRTKEPAPAKTFRVVVTPKHRGSATALLTIQGRWMIVNGRGDLIIANSKTDTCYACQVSEIASFAAGSWSYAYEQNAPLGDKKEGD